MESRRVTILQEVPLNVEIHKGSVNFPLDGVFADVQSVSESHFRNASRAIEATLQENTGPHKLPSSLHEKHHFC